MSNKVLIVAKAGTELSITEEAFFKKHFGEDCEVVTPEQAKERGLTPEDFGEPAREVRTFPKDEPYLIERVE